MRRIVAVSVVAATVCGSACSSDASGGEVATPPSVTTTPATSPPVSTSPATTAATTSTTVEPTSTTSTTTTTVAPTTTDPVRAIAEAVKQARLDAEAAYFAAASDPANPELRETLRQFFTAEFFVSNEAFLDELVGAGQRLKASDDTETTLSLVGDVELPQGASSTEAVIFVCRTDSDVIYVPTTAGDVVVNDEVVTTFTRTELSLVNGRWILTGGEIINRWTGVAECEQ